jgi:hypothetical protein
LSIEIIFPAWMALVRQAHHLRLQYSDSSFRESWPSLALAESSSMRADFAGSGSSLSTFAAVLAVKHGCAGSSIFSKLAKAFHESPTLASTCAPASRFAPSANADALGGPSGKREQHDPAKD